MQARADRAPAARSDASRHLSPDGHATVLDAAPLSTLLAGLHVVASSGDLDVPIKHITHDSRQVAAGTLFIAYRGVYQDVHRYLPDAFRRGAAAAIVERPLAELQSELGLDPTAALVQVGGARFARSHVAAALYGHPSRDMTVVGITGTDGKTTTSTIVHAILSEAGVPAGLVSTVSALTGASTLDTGLHVTTPEAEDLHAYLAEMRASGVQVAVLEVTSHGLAQERVSHVRFDVAAITNITHEALEYHETFEAYRRAKARLFHLVASGEDRRGVTRTAVLNLGDPSHETLSRIAVPRRLTFAVAGAADFAARDIAHSVRGTSFVATTPVGDIAVRSPLIGHYNVANILAAMAVAHALGVHPRHWSDGIAHVTGIPGRMELVDEGQAHLAVVDFAHTPNALEKALGTARELLGPTGRLIAVFGCAGLRDVQKRALMGGVAARAADLTFITAEDPRTESVDDIIAAVAEAMRAHGAREGRAFHRVPDRFEAIREACAAARAADVVIVTGKGHEQSMCFGETEVPWDDRAALRAALRGEPYRGGPADGTRGPSDA